MDYLFKNATVVRPEGILKNVYVAVKDGKIFSIGNEFAENIDNYEIIDAENKVILPGLINAHTHIPMTLLRGYADDYDLHTWLNDYIFPAEAKLDSRSVKAGSLLGIAEAIMSGTTSFSDMYYFCDDIIEAVLETGMKANVSRGLSLFGDFDKNTHQGFCELKSMKERWHKFDNGRIIIEASIHAEYTSDERLWRCVADYAMENELGIQVHLSETKSEHEECIKKYRKTPTELFLDAGVWDTRAIAAHGVHVTDSDMDILASKNVNIVHNPVSNGKLGSGICRVPELIKKGINVALGTDGVSSNNSHDMFEEMKTAILLQRASRLTPSALSKWDVFKMATVNGAKAQGRADECGEIKEGMDADIILLDFNKPRLVPCNDAVSNIVFSASGGEVCLTMCRGEILYQNGELKTLDLEKVLWEVRNYAVPKVLNV